MRKGGGGNPSGQLCAVTKTTHIYTNTRVPTRARKHTRDVHTQKTWTHTNTYKPRKWGTNSHPHYTRIKPKNRKERVLYLRRFYNKISQLSLCKTSVTVGKSVQPLLINWASNARQIRAWRSLPLCHTRQAIFYNLNVLFWGFFSCRYTSPDLYDSDLMWCVPTLLVFLQPTYCIHLADLLRVLPL